MKKQAGKATEAQLLELLKMVLPKATHDAKLAGKIYQMVETELKEKARATAFDEFCAKVALPDLEPKSLLDVKNQLLASFGEGEITLNQNEESQLLEVDVALPDGRQFSSQIKVNPNALTEENIEEEIVLKFIPAPVSLPGDPELVWYLARRETMTPDELGIALEKLEDDYWASKAGQKLIRKGTERSFPEFVARVPSAMLTELGIKRHYKTPEPVKVLRARKKP